MSACPLTLIWVVTRRQAQTQRSAAWVEKVDRPEAWAREHLWLLDAIFALFDRDGEWPRIEVLQRVLADSDTGRAVEVPQMAIDIPSELGAREVDRFTLTTRALSYCAGANSLLANFVAVVGQAVMGYRASDQQHPAVLSGFAVKDGLALDHFTYLKVSCLVFREPWFFGSGGGNLDGDWHYDIRAEVLLAEDVVDIAGYLDVVARYRFGPPEVAFGSLAASRPAIINITRSWLAKREMTVRDSLIVAIISAVVAGVCLWLLLR
jgi:hypothetical protein